MDVAIVDIDGTVADVRHRLHFIETTPKNWKSFFDRMDEDTPIVPMIKLVKALSSKMTIFYCTGRPANYGSITTNWLNLAELPDTKNLLMRPYKNFTSDVVVKQGQVNTIRKLGYNIVVAFDDREKVIQMYKENNIMTFDCSKSFLEE
jgi:uncharacterized HAD superfamily protein